jgi:AraC-like DNA-binding protein
MPRFADVREGCDRWDPHCRIPRHRHAQAYAALLLEGAYEESGSFGRHRVGAGQVLLHRAFDAHLNRFDHRGARILNMLLECAPDFPLGAVADPDRLARMAESDIAAAGRALTAQITPIEPVAADWPDLLAQDLRRDPGLSLGEWAGRHGLAPATLSRGFARVFGTSPARFRAEARTQDALALLNAGTPMAEVAAIAGFADQAHMTRAVGALTGRPPGHWREVKSVQDASRRGRL